MEKDKEITEEEARSYLSFYVADPERLDAYIARLHSAPSLKEVERILVAMVRAEGIPTDILTRQEFYMTVRVFFAHLKAGRSTLHDHFVNIQSVAKARTSAGDRRALLNSFLSEGIEIPVPKPGEEVSYTIELVIKVSKDSHKLLVTVAGAVAGCFPLPLFGMFYQSLPLSHTEPYTLTGTPAELVTSLEQLSSILGDDKGVEVEYRSPLMYCKHLSVRQTLDLLKQEPQ